MAVESEKDYGDAALAARIVAIRSGSGLSAAAFAKRLGVSQPTQSRIERAKRLPDSLYLRRLREQFQVDINALLTGDEVEGLAPDESVLLDNYRNSSAADQAALKTASNQGEAAQQPVRRRPRAA